MGPRWTRGALVDVDITDVAVGAEAGAAHELVTVVLQSDRFRYGRTVLVVPLTTNLAIQTSPLAVRVDPTAGNGLAAPSVVMCWQLMAVDGSRIRTREGATLDRWVLDVVAKNVAILTGHTD